jgi:hypothetical protein
MRIGRSRCALAVVASLTFISCGGSAQQPAATPPAASAPAGAPDAALRNELLLRVRSDQAARELFMLKQRTNGIVDSADVARLGVVDTANTHWLERLIARQGWPTKAQVGVDGVRGALLLVQHADLDTAFQARVLPLIQKSYATGDLPGGDVAMLTDRVAVNHGRPQVYGTQAKFVNGRWVPSPIADSASVDVRRAAMGLPPLSAYFRILDSLYNAPR